MGGLICMASTRLNKIHGVTITLLTKQVTGTDGFRHEIIEEVEEDVDDVLFYPSSAEDVTSSTDLWGKKAAYTLAIPKGDTHNWKDAKVVLPLPTGAETFRTFGEPMSGIEANLPGRWNTKVWVERYE